MDHIELIARLRQHPNVYQDELHYDLRTRGGNDENDIDAALKRIYSVTDLLQEEVDCTSQNRPMQAFFKLSGDPTEFKLATTLERELGFGVHHAIHHMAMVKIIAVQTLGIPPDELASDFGRAPSTVVHDEKIF